MRYLLYFLLAISCIIFSCQRNVYPGAIGRALGPEIQRYNIVIGQDTIIRCKGGAVLRFCPSTFVCSEKKIMLEIQEVKDRGEAFLLGLSTLDAKGRLLETEGMFYLNAHGPNGEKVSIDAACPAKLELPVKGRRPGTKWFYGNESGQMLLWEQVSEGFENGAEVLRLETGQANFKKLCANCHCPNLSNDYTGPALGNITRYRDANWLRQFTRNSQAFIASSDSMAICTWNKWKPSVMSSFPELSDDQIDAIYQFIEEESARLGVTIDSSNYSCWPESQCQHNADTSNAPLTRGFGVKSNPYFAKIYQVGWFNCDLFYNDTTARTAVVKVKVANPEQYEEVLVGILFDQLNANIELTSYESGQYETYREMDIRLPQAPAQVVAIGIKGKQWFKFEQAFMVGGNNEFTASLAATTAKEIKTFINSNAFKQPQVKSAQMPCYSEGQ